MADLKTFIQEFENTCSICGEPLAVGETVYAPSRDAIRAGGSVCFRHFGTEGRGPEVLDEERAELEAEAAEGDEKTISEMNVAQIKNLLPDVYDIGILEQVLQDEKESRKRPNVIRLLNSRIGALRKQQQ